MSGEVTQSTKVLIPTARLDSFDRNGANIAAFSQWPVGFSGNCVGRASGAGPTLKAPQSPWPGATPRLAKKL